jgi:hypothetical protein
MQRGAAGDPAATLSSSEPANGFSPESRDPESSPELSNVIPDLVRQLGILRTRGLAEAISSALQFSNHCPDWIASGAWHIEPLR